MDRKDNDFADDLSSLAVGVKAEVGDMLQVLRDRKTPGATKVVALKDASAVTVKVSKATTSEQGAEGQEPKRRTQDSRTRVKTIADEPVVLENVTTRLRRDTNALLTESALRQKLKKELPDTRQDIIEAALDAWFRQLGYRR